MIYDFSWVVLAIITLLLLFSLYLLFSISYTINGNTLIVKCGIFSTAKYNIDDIYKIIDTNTTLASLASSLERIAIYFKGQKHPLIISPKNKQIFINNLQKINDKITWLQ